ncbi:MAG: amidohydrolase family protein [Anaerolineales bacterium]|nr:amidohydrolase family protein [Anaerolineales bacterium]
MKPKIDLLLTNAIVLTMDEAFRKYDHGGLAIQGDQIYAVGSSEKLREEFEADSVVDCQGKVVMPGLINTHTHLAMNLLRGLADDLRLDVWLLGYIMPVEREFVSPEFVRLGTTLACAELIQSGVTAFADMYYFEDQVAQSAADAGLRGVCSQTILKFKGPDASTYEEALDSAETLIKKWKGHPLITPAVAPHAAYTSTEDILASSRELAVSSDVPLHIHIAETSNEVEECIENYEMRVVHYLEKQGLFSAKTIAAHCVHIDESEMHTLNHHNVGIAHNPTSNLKLGSGIAPVPAMLNAGLNVGIGTDGVSSNNDLDMFEEMRLAALLAKGNTGDPTLLPAKTALAMATRRGAEAIHIAHQTGSLSAGKKADLIMVDISTLHNSPRFHNDPDGVYAQLVYAAKSTDVQDVMVNGKWLMRSRELLTLDVEELLPKAQKIAGKIDRFVSKREQSVYSKLIAVGGAVEQESYEVQAKVKVEDPQAVIKALKSSDLEIIYDRHYHEYDTYFEFEDSEEGWLRYREDEFINDRGEVYDIRYRLTLIGPERERKFPQEVLLSRSRFIAPASHSLRFYREYFQPTGETFIEKDRLRWKVSYHGIDFYINVDRLDDPDLGTFLEVKSRTWSLEDAEKKSEMADDLLNILGVSPQERRTDDYVLIVESESA